MFELLELSRTQYNEKMHYMALEAEQIDSVMHTSIPSIEDSDPIISVKIYLN